jgi:tRNA(Ile)-lysidine synthase
MLVPGDRVLIGVSGGPDSMVLLHLLNHMSLGLDIRLGVAHLHHDLRGAAADRDARLVRRTATKLELPCHVTRAHVIKVKRKLGISLEDAAHRVRYAFFNATMRHRGYNKLALGHHMADNAEHVLMAILRGTGPRGLSGIAPVRENRIVRPLIDACRSHIDAYVKTAGIPCNKDSSNTDQRFDRNRIRHHLLPLLRSGYNPRIIESLNRLADIMRTETAWTEALVETEWQTAVRQRTPDTVSIASDALTRSHRALARRLVRKAMESLTGSIRKIQYGHIEDVLDMAATSGGETKTRHLPGGIRVCRRGQTVEISSGHPAGRPDSGDPAACSTKTDVTVDGPFPSQVVLPVLGVGLRFTVRRPDELPHWSEAKDNRAYLDLHRLRLPLTVRTTIPGDRFRPMGAGGTQKVKKYFIDHRIPRQIRARTPVLTDCRRIVWLVGLRIDDSVKITPETTHILEAEFFLLDTR